MVYFCRPRSAVKRFCVISSSSLREPRADTARAAPGQVARPLPSHRSLMPRGPLLSDGLPYLQGPPECSPRRLPGCPRCKHPLSRKQNRFRLQRPCRSGTAQLQGSPCDGCGRQHRALRRSRSRPAACSPLAPGPEPGNAPGSRWSPVISTKQTRASRLRNGPSRGSRCPAGCRNAGAHCWRASLSDEPAACGRDRFGRGLGRVEIKRSETFPITRTFHCR